MGGRWTDEQRLSVVLHAAVAWQTVNELACGDSGIVHFALVAFF